MSISGASVLITGGAGFIGSEVVRQLAERGARVTIVDNLVNGKRANVEDVLSDRVRLEVLDIRNTDAMASLFSKTDLVYHLACLGVRHSIHSPIENNDVNALATLRLLEAARAAKLARFVYVSSSEVYGTAREVPMQEERHPVFPMTVYGAGKLAGECYTRAYHSTYGFPTVVVRPFNSYGPRSHHEGDSGEVIPKFMLRAMTGRPLVIFGDGHQTRDFTFVSDTARGIIECGIQPGAIGETINIANGKEIAIKDLAEVVARAIGKKVTVQHDADRPGDVLRLYADTSKAEQLLGYKSEVTLEEGLRRLYQWYLSQDASPEQLLEQERLHNWLS